MGKCWDCKNLGKCLKTELVDTKKGCREFSFYKGYEYTYNEVAKIIGYNERRINSSVKLYRNIIMKVKEKTGKNIALVFNEDDKKFHFEIME